MRVFISYGWKNDDDENKKKDTYFIDSIYSILCEKGIDARYDERILDKNSLEFMKEEINKADAIIVLINNTYLDKLNNPASGVFKEFTHIINRANYNDIVIPIIIDKNISMPREFNDLLFINLSKSYNKEFVDDEDLNGLVKRICGICNDYSIIPKPTISPQCEKFLNDIGIFNNFYKEKDLKLDDIYVYPLLIKDENKVNCEDFIKNYSETLTYFSGDRQSGKTTLAKKMFLDFYERSYYPVYIDCNNISNNRIESVIKSELRKQYITPANDLFNNNNLLLIFDDFHILNKNRTDKILNYLQGKKAILFVDNIYFIKEIEEANIDNYIIKEFKKSQRKKLITKIIEKTENLSQHDLEIQVDNKMQYLQRILGFTMRRKLIPSYPFYLLSVLITSNQFTHENDKISHSGHCYHALVTTSLTVLGIEDDLLDSYFNFLSQFAFYLFKNKKQYLNSDDYMTFLKDYSEKFMIPKIKEKQGEKLEGVDENTSNWHYYLVKSKLIFKNTLNCYEFHYLYLYYYFVGSYLADKYEENLSLINDIINNLHSEENSNIAIFIAHNTNNLKFINLIMDNLDNTFKDIKETTLSKCEVGLFDEDINDIIQSMNLDIKSQKESMVENEKSIIRQEEIEEKIGSKNEIQLESDCDEYSDDEKRIINALNSTEVIGEILKNRSGKMDLPNVKSILLRCVNVNLRIISYFFQLREQQKEKLTIAINRIKEHDTEDKYGNKVNVSETEIINYIHKTIFFIYLKLIQVIIYHTIQSLGSNRFSSYYYKMLMESNSPAYIVIAEGLDIDFSHNVDVNRIKKEFKIPDFSEVAKLLVLNKVVNYTIMFTVSHEDRQRIKQKLFNNKDILYKKTLISSVMNKKENG